jgi:hypothetical protein
MHWCVDRPGESLEAMDGKKNMGMQVVPRHSAGKLASSMIIKVRQPPCFGWVFSVHHCNRGAL